MLAERRHSWPRSENGSDSTSSSRWAKSLRSAFARHVLGEHDELVAAEPRRGVGGTNGVHDPLRHDLEHLVAGEVPERVVDVLEAVEIDEEHRDHVAVPARDRQRVRETVEERAAIEQRRERVVVGEPVDVLLGQLLLCDLAADPAITDEPPRGIEHGLTADRRVGRAAHGMDPSHHDVEVGLARGEPRAVTNPAAVRRLDARNFPARASDLLVDREARDLGEVAADRGEPEVDVLFPIPVGAERCEAPEARLARGECRGAIADARFERVPLVVERVVELLHLARRNVLRALEQVAVLVGAAVALAHLLEQRPPRVGGRHSAWREPQAPQLTAQKVMQMLHGSS